VAEAKRAMNEMLSDVHLKDGRVITAVLETNPTGSAKGSGCPKDF
jgi:hypothetical protein